MGFEVVEVSGDAAAADADSPTDASAPPDTAACNRRRRERSGSEGVAGAGFMQVSVLRDGDWGFLLIAFLRKHVQKLTHGKHLHPTGSVDKRWQRHLPLR
jgi:hypothetical protein|nr:hypothetical protein [uncultured Ralstonia sp.]